MDEIIRTENLVKRYDKVSAVKGVSLSVKKGEIYGFLGLNGAGKTTMIKMLLGIIQPTSGNCYLDNKKIPVKKRMLWNKVGYMVEIPYHYPELTVRENLELFRKMRFIGNEKAVDEVMDKLALTQYSKRKTGTLSLGNSQRLGIAKAFLHNPEILILDEPANGLDPAGIVEIRKMLVDMAKNHGVTVFISSHILGEIAKFAGKIGIIHEGELLQEINTEELEQLRSRKLQVIVKDQGNCEYFLRSRGYQFEIKQNRVFEFAIRKFIDDPSLLNKELVEAGFSPSMLNVAEEDLESYFLRVIQKESNR